MSSTGCRMGRADNVTRAAGAPAEECRQLRWQFSACSHTRRSKAWPALSRLLLQILAYRQEQNPRKRILAYRPARIPSRSVRLGAAAGLVICSKADWAGYLPAARREACSAAA